MKRDFSSLYNPSLRAQKKIITTEDGTQTLYSKEFDECYHGIKDGALKESLKKHVEPAYNLIKNRDSITILDICYGLGFNTLATLYFYKIESPNSKLHIISPELDESLVKSLKDFNYPKEFDDFKDIIKQLSKNFKYEDKNIKIDILIGDARDEVNKIDRKIDIIYQDAFSPKKNPALWTREWFKDLKNISNSSVVLTTYSVATSIRLALYENGFNIYMAPQLDIRSGTIASLSSLPLERVDMELKKERNPHAIALQDIDIN